MYEGHASFYYAPGVAARFAGTPAGRVATGGFAMNGRRLAIAVAAIALSASVFSAGAARADSGEFNLHIEPSAGVALAGDGISDLPAGSTLPIGIVGWIGFDYQLAPPFAIEAI